MDITWIRELPLIVKALLVAIIVGGLMYGIWRLKKRNPASRGSERKLQQKRDEETRRYDR